MGSLCSPFIHRLKASTPHMISGPSLLLFGRLLNHWCFIKRSTRIYCQPLHNLIFLLILIQDAKGDAQFSWWQFIKLGLLDPVGSPLVMQTNDFYRAFTWKITALQNVWEPCRSWVNKEILLREGSNQSHSAHPLGTAGSYSAVVPGSMRLPILNSGEGKRKWGRRRDSEGGPRVRGGPRMMSVLTVIWVFLLAPIIVIQSRASLTSSWAV